MRLLTVLVTDGQLRPSLAAVRSLGRAGHRVYVCGPRRRTLAGASRYAYGQAQVPDALAQPAAYAEAIIALTQRWAVDTLVPMSEESLLALMPVTTRMPGVIVPFAPLEAFRHASDKQYITALAASLDIAVPEQAVLESADAVDRLDLTSLGLPVVLKPARSVGGVGAAQVKLGVGYACDHEELRRKVRALPQEAFPLLVQRRIDGPGTGVFLLVWKGALLAQFAHRRIREKPPSGGVSVCAESIACDADTVEQSQALLAHLDWAGPAMVEYKQDRVTGRRYLMEVNGRFWGSLQLAIDAGVDFPALLVAAASGAEPAPVTHYAVGVRTRWWWGEVDHLIARLRGGARAASTDSLAQAVRVFLFPGSNVRNEVLRANDPFPIVRESIEWFQGR